MQDNLARTLNTTSRTMPARKPQAKPAMLSAKSVFSFVSFLVLCSALLMLVVLRFATINELEKEILLAKDTYETLYSENTTAKVQLQGSIDLKEIERIASEELGMVTPDQTQIVNIRVSVDNHAQVLSGKTNKNSDTDSGESFMSNILSYLH
ncbi:MAG: hypothetical protein IKT39_00085 [Clostridia bacterium]|nr:hypothetical protein [Clostridia bacterium]